MPEQTIQHKKKEFTYRGKTLEELKTLDIREFAKLVKSNTKRTIMRQSDELQSFMNLCNKKVMKKKLIKTHARHLVIVPKMVGMRIGIRIFLNWKMHLRKSLV